MPLLLCQVSVVVKICRFQGRNTPGPFNEPVVLHSYQPGKTGPSVIQILSATGRQSEEALLSFLPTSEEIPDENCVESNRNQELQQRKRAAAPNKPLMMREPPPICKSMMTVGAALLNVGSSSRALGDARQTLVSASPQNDWF
jgi:hypothetical protein